MLKEKQRCKSEIIQRSLFLLCQFRILNRVAEFNIFRDFLCSEILFAGRLELAEDGNTEQNIGKKNTLVDDYQ